MSSHVSVKAYGSLDDGITDFLVNDLFDVNDEPDILYFSQGNKTAKVSPATSGSFTCPCIWSQLYQCTYGNAFCGGLELYQAG